MNRILSVSLLTASLALAAVPLGCSGGAAESSPAATSANAITTAPVAVAAHGRVRFFGEALSQVPLRTDQRAEIEKLAADSDARHQPIRDAHKAVLLTLADQIERGSVDRAGLQSGVDAAGAAIANTQAADRAAFERLHAILDAGQRNAFVDAVESKFHSHKGHSGGMGRMDEWASYLSLTDAQKEQIRGILKDRFAAHHGDWKDAREKGKRVFETFRTDHFVLDELAPPMDAKAKASAMTDHFVGVAEAVLPVLTPEQRTLAAKKLREKAEGGTADEME